MYNNNIYEEYMQGTLGYNMNPMNSGNNEIYENENVFNNNQLNIDNMYPEIYKIIYPMVCKACMNVQENITDDLVSRLTNEIYMNVENIETLQESRDTKVNNVLSSNKNLNRETTNTKTNNIEANLTRREDRRTNFLLRDLIRILVLRELFGRPYNPSGRPPFGMGIGPSPRRPYIF